jgi:hypothetical protein
MEGYESNIKKKRDDLLRAMGSAPEVAPLIPEKEDIVNVKSVKPASKINEHAVETPIQPVSKIKRNQFQRRIFKLK